MSQAWESIWYPRRAEGWLRRAALSPLGAVSLLFRAAVQSRNAAYARGWLPSAAVEGASVISIGNLNVGGTGKTPAVIYLANLCHAEGHQVAVLSRGYGRRGRGVARVSPQASADAFGDEPVLIARRCPAAVVLVGDDRLQLAELARREHGSDLMILDDGMQYRRLRKDLEVVVVDEAAGFGNGKLLPRGPLREPPAALERADLLWIRAGSRRAFESVGCPTVRAGYVASGLLPPAGDPEPLTAAHGRCVYAFAGVARPESFLETVRELNAVLVGSRFFPDHHWFTQAELDDLLREAKRQQAEMLITTEKDLVRLPPGFPAWAVRLEVKILQGADTLSHRLSVL